MRVSFPILLCLATAVTGAPAEVTTGIDEQAQLPYWQLDDDMMSLRLVQRLPIQSRAFFLARGFTHEQAARIADSCVFQTVFRNRSHQTDHPSPLRYRLDDWIVHHGGGEQGLATREYWAGIWEREGVAKPVRLAFEWALYPTVQEYQPGDYNWGMSLFNLKPGSRFDLEVHWEQSGERHSAVIPGMRCAMDTDVATEVVRP